MNTDSLDSSPPCGERRGASRVAPRVRGSWPLAVKFRPFHGLELTRPLTLAVRSVRLHPLPARGRGVQLMVVVCLFIAPFAHASPAQLKRANRQFVQGDYENALKTY